MADKMRDRDDSGVGYVPKADATRGSEDIPHPATVQKIESDQTARRPEVEHIPEDPADDEETAHDRNRGGRYGDGW